MKCQIPNSPARNAQRAYSMMEMTVAFGIASLVMAVAMQLSMFTSRSFAAMGNYADLDRISRNALDNMSRDIREAKVLGLYTSHRLFFTNMSSPTWFGYVWNPSTKTMAKVSGNLGGGNVRSNVVLTGCDYFSFRIWLRNPTNGFWFPYSAAGQQQNTKLVDVSWRCSRRVLNQFNTESVQTAKIVLRN